MCKIFCGLKYLYLQLNKFTRCMSFQTPPPTSFLFSLTPDRLTLKHRFLIARELSSSNFSKTSFIKNITSDKKKKKKKGHVEIKEIVLLLSNLASFLSPDLCNNCCRKPIKAAEKTNGDVLLFSFYFLRAELSCHISGYRVLYAFRSGSVS